MLLNITKGKKTVTTINNISESNKPKNIGNVCIEAIQMWPISKLTNKSKVLREQSKNFNDYNLSTRKKKKKTY